MTRGAMILGNVIRTAQLWDKSMLVAARYDLASRSPSSESAQQVWPLRWFGYYLDHLATVA